MIRDMEATLCQIVSGQRAAADLRDEMAHGCLLRGDIEGAERFRRAADHARAQAYETVRGLAQLVVARWESPENEAQAAEARRLSAQDRAHARAMRAQADSMAQERLAARRAGP